MGDFFRAACGIAALACAGCADAPEERFDPTPIEAALKSFVADGRAVGVSALVYKDGEEAYFGAFGLRDREANLPMTRDTIVRIQSMTKPLTGVALMQLYDEGKLDLDDPIAKYAPEFAGVKVWERFDEKGDMVLVDPKRPPTIRDLGRHTAGFYLRGFDSPLRDLVVAVNPIDPNNTLAEFSRKLATLPLLYHPGERILYAYSTDMQAYIVERITGEPFGDALQRRVLGPLAMNDTDYYTPEEKRGRVAAAYTVGAAGALERATDGPGNFRRWPLTPGGHGLTSTIDDYMHFALMIQNEGEISGVRLLKPETVRLMGTDQLPAAVTDRSWPSPDGDIGWGINFAVRTAPPKSSDANFGVVGEMYWEGAGGTLFWIDPANDLTAILFLQRDDYASVHKDFRDAVYKAIGLGFAGAGPSP